MNHEVVKDKEAVERVTLGRVARTFKAYRVPILLSLAAVMTGYLIVAALMVLMSPTLTVTSLPFRLEFQNAEEGKYPNGRIFSPTEIVAQPILTRVWEQNDLKRFMPLSAFQTSVYVIEANPAMERLVRDYQARIADPKLSPIDRDRLVREFESKKESISKNQYSLNFSAARNAQRLPDALVKKVLTDVLRAWAEHSVREQRVLQYGVAVLSPNTVPTNSGTGNYIVRLQVLRANIYRVIDNINLLEELPGGRLARTRADQLSLNDLRTQLDDVVRFRLEPLVPAIRSSGLVPNIADAIRFAEMQLAYDERQVAYARDRAQVIRQAILTYANASGTAVPPEIAEGSPDHSSPNGRPAATESVTPQLSDSFLDRLVSMTAATADVDYRQGLIDDYRGLAVQIPPLQLAVSYDTEVLDQLRAPSTGSASVTAQDAESQINAMQREVHDAVTKMNELYLQISSNLAPETRMYSATSVPATRTERRVEPDKLAALGVLIFFLSLPIVLAGVLIHNRLRQEDEIEEHREAEAVAVAR